MRPPTKNDQKWTQNGCKCIAFGASSLGLFGLTFLLKIVVGPKNLKHTLHAKPHFPSLPTHSLVTLPATCLVADSPARKEGAFVQVASPRGDLVLTTSFSRDASDKPIRPAEVQASRQSGACSGKFNGLFSQQ